MTSQRDPNRTAVMCYVPIGRTVPMKPIAGRKMRIKTRPMEDVALDLGCDFVDTPNANVTLLVKEWTPHYLEHNSFVAALLKRPNVSSLRIVVSAMESLPDAERDSWRNDIAVLMAHEPKLNAYEIDFAAKNMSAAFDDGLRVQINGAWYLIFDKKDRLKFEEVPQGASWSQSFYRIVGDAKVKLEVSDDELVKKPTVVPHYRPVVPAKGTAYSSFTMQKICTELGMNGEVSKIEIIDSFFWTPVEWKTLFLMLKSLKIKDGASLAITALDPTERCKFESDFCNLHTAVQDVPCGYWMNCALKKEDADQFAEYICEHVNGVASCTVNYAKTKPGHDRYVKLTMGGMDVEFAFGKGFDFLDYSAAGTRKLFTSAADALARYNDRVTFSRISE